MRRRLPAADAVAGAERARAARTRRCRRAAGALFGTDSGALPRRAGTPRMSIERRVNLPLAARIFCVSANGGLSPSPPRAC